MSVLEYAGRFASINCVFVFIAPESAEHASDSEFLRLEFVHETPGLRVAVRRYKLPPAIELRLLHRPSVFPQRRAVFQFSMSASRLVSFPLKSSSKPIYGLLAFRKLFCLLRVSPPKCSLSWH